MKYVIGKRNNPYGVTNCTTVCEVLSEFRETGTGIERIIVRILYRRRDLLFEECNDERIDFFFFLKY